MSVHAGVKMSGRYLGQLKTEVTHGPSGTVLKTAAPVDNNGDGSSFSPTDLVGTALGACMLTIMGIVAERDGIDMSQVSFTVEKEMAAQPVRRIGKLTVVFQMPDGLSEAQRGKLERAAHTCPVHQSLHPDIELTIIFNYPE